ncbi:MAG: DNA translocase FtsK [Dehalococcoidia bacterium]
MANKKGKAKNTRPGGLGSRLIHSKWFLSFTAIILVAGGVYLFRDQVAEGVFKACGLGIAIVALWLAVAVWVLWKRRLPGVRRYWNTWLAALIFSAAVLGIMGLTHPSLSVAGVQMEDTTLAGSMGKEIAGGSWEWARILGMVIAAIVFFAPRESINTTRQVSASTWNWSKPRALLLLVQLSQLLRKLLLRILGWIKAFIAGIFGLARRKKVLPTTATRKPRKGMAGGAGTANPDQATQAVAGTDELPEAVQEAKPSVDRQLPSIEILDEAPKANFAQADNDERARLIEEALASYGVEVKVKQINPGPSVTQFGVEPGWARKYKKVIEKGPDGKPVLDKDGNPRYHMEEISRTRVKVERITALANDLALALAVSDIRIEAPVPGKAMVGIEVPNTSTAIVSLRGVIESQPFQKIAAKSKLAIALGLGSGGEPAAGDLAKMPHVLIAGATGSGKSVCLNCIVSCIMAQTSPHDVRLVLIDPKRVEMVTFSDIPHLITPVVVDVDKAIDTLKRVTMEMDNRYHKFAEVGARNIEGYNKHPNVTEPLPYLVIIIDELADLMMTSADVVEPLLCRLAQLSRATGIHLVVATQRPSVDVITGLIKANFPTRISFAVVSSIDSRTILDSIGAEKLLGKGDMLYIPPEANKPKRIRGCFVSDEEIERLVNFWKEWASVNFPPETDVVAQKFASLNVVPVETDPFLEKARQVCAESGRVSASLLQRKLHIGYQRAARLMDQMEEEGLLDEAETSNPWEGEP